MPDYFNQPVPGYVSTPGTNVSRDANLGMNPAMGAAGAAAGGIMGMPWSVVIPILLSVFGGLFEKEEDPMDEALKLQQQMKQLGIQKPYQNPYLPQMSEAAMRGVLGQMGQTAGWGWPADRQPDMSWLAPMMENLPTGTGGTRRRLPA